MGKEYSRRGKAQAKSLRQERLRYTLQTGELNMIKMWKMRERLAWTLSEDKAWGEGVEVMQGLLSYVDDFGLYPNQTLIYG